MKNAFDAAGECCVTLMVGMVSLFAAALLPGSSSANVSVVDMMIALAESIAFELASSELLPFNSSAR